jgi:hypothetical protein
MLFGSATSINQIPPFVGYITSRVEGFKNLFNIIVAISYLDYTGTDNSRKVLMVVYQSRFMYLFTIGGLRLLAKCEKSRVVVFDHFGVTLNAYAKDLEIRFIAVCL